MALRAGAVEFSSLFSAKWGSFIYRRVFLGRKARVGLAQDQITSAMIIKVARFQISASLKSTTAVIPFSVLDAKPACIQASRSVLCFPALIAYYYIYWTSRVFLTK